MKRTRYTPRFKFDRVVESLKKNSVSEIARQYGFGVNLLSKWRSDFLKGGHCFFETKPDAEITRLRKSVGNLEQMVGKKEVELNLLKNFSDFYQSRSGP